MVNCSILQRSLRSSLLAVDLNNRHSEKFRKVCTMISTFLFLSNSFGWKTTTLLKETSIMDIFLQFYQTVSQQQHLWKTACNFYLPHLLYTGSSWVEYQVSRETFIFSYIFQTVWHKKIKKYEVNGPQRAGLNLLELFIIRPSLMIVYFLKNMDLTRTLI